MVHEQLSLTTPIAAGIRSLPGTAKAFASTQAAYRMFGVYDVPLPALAFPLLHAAREAVANECSSHALVVHDWSNLHYNNHASKIDRVALSCKKDLGYELQSALLVSDAGQPISPVSMSLRASDGVHTTLRNEVRPALSALDGLQPTMDHVASLQWDKPVVHIIDAEADSVAHFRQWNQAGHHFLVRADEQPRVEFEDQTLPLGQVADQLRLREKLGFSRDVQHQGQPAKQYVAETNVVLTRPARPRRRDGETGRDAPRRSVAGEALPLRLVVSEVRDLAGTVLARWLLLTNVSSEISATQIALWYYWRWDIESYFKLLKGAGLNLEDWQQESASALTRRLLVAAMACVVLWRLERDESEPAQEVKKILIRLSGRQMKRGTTSTAPAMLAGLWTLLAMLDLLESYDPEKLRALLKGVGLGKSPPSRRRPPDKP